MNYEEQRDDDADCHPDFDAPADRQRESEEHQCEVNPRPHPVERRVKCVSSSLKGRTDLQ